MRALIVIPTYQEAGNIDSLLRRIRSVSPTISVLIVDDASPDGTADAVEALREELGGISILRRAAKNGLGPANRAGFSWALDQGYELVVSMDADLSHDPLALLTLVEAIECGADLAIGSRYVPGGAIPQWPRYRRALSYWGNRYATAVLRLDLKDATSGYRAYRASLLRSIGLQHIRSNGYCFQTEMAYRAVRLHMKVVEVPICFSDRKNGVSKMSTRILLESLLLVTLWGVRDLATRPFPRISTAP